MTPTVRWLRPARANRDLRAVDQERRSGQARQSIEQLLVVPDGPCDRRVERVRLVQGRLLLHEGARTVRIGRRSFHTRRRKLAHVAKGLEWVDDARAAAQAQLTEPIVAVGFLQPGGSWGAFGISKLNPVAGSVEQADANQRAGGLAKAGGFKPKVAMLAVTADTVYVFSAAPARKRSVKVGELLDAWACDDLSIGLVPGRVATQVTIDVVSTGQRYELEATMIGGGFNDGLLAELDPPAP